MYGTSTGCPGLEQASATSQQAPRHGSSLLGALNQLHLLGSVLLQLFVRATQGSAYEGISILALGKNIPGQCMRNSTQPVLRN
jgi:hypothetical protein